MKPTAIILDLLRTYGRRGTTVKTIMATGAMFEFSDNVMRVSLSRLVARGTVENFTRGQYRLADRADPLNDFVEQWRRGEDRVRPWDGDAWLLVHTDSETASKRDWALDARGFRRISPGLWSRPDNLADTAADQERLLRRLGLDDAQVFIANARIAPRWQDAWCAQFDTGALDSAYRRAHHALSESLARIDRMPYESALKETFHRGGNAVHILAKDPLLPSQMIDTAPRRELWQIMLSYDRKGREIWGERSERRPDAIPTPQLHVANI